MSEGEAGNASTSNAGRLIRSDARENRQRILNAAEIVFGEGGIDASTEQVADLAGVGIGTVFRHFPAKRDLLEAVLVRRLERLRDEALALTDSRDPGKDLFRFFAKVVQEAPGKIAISNTLIDTADGIPGSAHIASNELRDAVGQLLNKAKSAGAVRDEVELPEFYALLIGASRVEALTGIDPGVQERMLKIIFDGLAPRPEVGR